MPRQAPKAKAKRVTRVTGSATVKKMSEKNQPMTLADRVRASEARKIKAGGRRLPGGMLPADAVAALDSLQARGYAPSAAGCIARSLVEAAAVMDENDRVISKGKRRG